jgi:hypothetical protein
MTAEELEARILSWAQSQPDVEALIQIGSRAQSGAEVDAWSDWDYHLVVRDPARYRNVIWLEDIAPSWSAHLEQTERGVAKLSAVFFGGMEVDFVPLTAWQMKLVYWAMGHPAARWVYPKPLIKGIYNTRLIVLPGYRVLIGGLAWKKRLAALRTIWPEKVFTSDQFHEILSGFWRHAVWVHKKIMRGETRAALQWYHAELTNRRLDLLAEEARLAGRPARPEARKAEKWLDARRVEQTDIETSPDQRVLARALLAEIALFEDVSRSVAQTRGFKLPDYAPVATWLRAGLSRFA